MQTVHLMGALFKMSAKMTRFSNWEFLVKSWSGMKTTAELVSRVEKVEPDIHCSVFMYLFKRVQDTYTAVGLFSTPKDLS